MLIRFWKRASSYAPQAVQGRFIKSWRAYLDSVITQAARRDLSHYVCTIEEYLDSRCDNIGAYPSFIFLELSLNIDIPHYVMENSTIVTLNRVAADMIALGNVTIYIPLLFSLQLINTSYIPGHLLLQEGDPHQRR